MPFYSCSNLVVTATDTLDLTGAISLSSAFFECTSLTALDASGWDTSAITDCEKIFINCSALSTLDVADWDVSSITTFKEAFASCASLTTLDVSKWNVSNVLTFEEAFRLTSIQRFAVENWNVSSVTNFAGTFAGTPVTSLDLHKWNVSNVTTFANFCNNCTQLTYVNIDNWDLHATMLEFQNAPLTRPCWDKILIQIALKAQQYSIENGTTNAYSRYTKNSRASEAVSTLTAMNWTVTSIGNTVWPTNVWTNKAGDNDANNAQNWSDQYVPSDYDGGDVVLFDSFSDDCIMSANMTAKSIKFDQIYTGTFNSAGYDLNIFEKITINGGKFINLANSIWTCDTFEANNVDLTASENWTLAATTSAVAGGEGSVSNSIATGVSVFAYSWNDLGNNANWGFVKGGVKFGGTIYLTQVETEGEQEEQEELDPVPIILPEPFLKYARPCPKSGGLICPNNICTTIIPYNNAYISAITTCRDMTKVIYLVIHHK